MYIQYILLIALLLLNSSAFAENKNKSQQDKLEVKKIIEKYCSSEFYGVPDIRLDLITYSAERQKKESARDPELNGMVIAIEADPLVIVKSYKIISISHKNNSALARVMYETLAKTIGDGLEARKILPVKETEIVKFHLIKQGNKWLILDPPIPRISKKAMIEYYEKDIQRVRNFIDKPETSRAQKQAQDLMIKNLDILKSL